VTLAWINPDERLERLVVIAPHGRDYHRLNPALLIAIPACAAFTKRWVTTDVTLAQQLDRLPCSQCWPDPPRTTDGQETD
jgi:hypothetical protein